MLRSIFILWVVLTWKYTTTAGPIKQHQQTPILMRAPPQPPSYQYNQFGLPPGVIKSEMPLLGPSSYLASTSSSICTSRDCVIAAGRILQTMNTSANPCLDFYEYACGNYQMVEDIPAGQFGMSPFNKAQLFTQKRLRALLEDERPDKNESEARRKIRNYYTSCLNQTATDRIGIQRLRNMVSDLGNFRLLNGSFSDSAINWSLDELLMKRNNYAVVGLFAFGIGADDKDARINRIQLDQGGLGLGPGSRDYYINATVRKDPILSAYASLMEIYAKSIVGKQNVDRKFVYDVIEFEQRLALIQDSKEDRRDVMKLYRPVNLTWLHEKAGFINWTLFFEEVFRGTGVTVNDSEVMVMYAEPYFLRLTELLREYMANETGRQAIHNYILFRTVAEYAPDYGSDFYDAHEQFQIEFGGKKGKTEQWIKCVSLFESEIGFPLSAMFVEKFFGRENKEMTEKVIKSIQPIFHYRVLSKADWMLADDKKVAIDKLESMNFNVAFPDWLFNDTYMDEIYAELEITPEDFTANVIASYHYLKRRMLADLRKPVDATRWKLTPHTINAYYDASYNKFIIPAGLLIEPFFYPERDAPLALNFGSLGAVTAHEIVHSVDDQGRQFDKFGSLRNWWHNETVERFENLTSCLVDQYNQYHVRGMRVRGLQTLGENIADNGGIKTAFDAFKQAERQSRFFRWSNARPASQLPGISATPDQLFFVAYAQVWCSIQSDAVLKMVILTDEHAPNKVRVNAPLSNMPEFAKAFNCPLNSPMNPVQKCSVW